MYSQQSELPTINIREVQAVPVWIVNSLKDVDIELLIVCPMDIYRKLEFAAKIIGWAAKLTGVNVKLTVQLNPER